MLVYLILLLLSLPRSARCCVGKRQLSFKEFQSFLAKLHQELRELEFR